MSTDSNKPALVELSEKNFDEVIAGNKTVLVDFWATWCGPCQFMLPIFDKLAKKYEEKVIVGRLNVDDNKGVAMRFDVYAIPTFIVFMNGKLVEKAVGAVGEKCLEGLLEKYQYTNFSYIYQNAGSDSRFFDNVRLKILHFFA